MIEQFCSSRWRYASLSDALIMRWRNKRICVNIFSLLLIIALCFHFYCWQHLYCYYQYVYCCFIVASRCNVILVHSDQTFTCCPKRCSHARFKSDCTLIRGCPCTDLEGGGGQGVRTPPPPEKSQK